ncbi:hypothetical protein TNCT_347531 [Trichonephila clavata]|uniref:Uncharacterized protein n=1 Tax=Trichonephila clavata TaxID=2740835 RepID=A0A8X6KCK9_TRICU|nr:hypothetical protein TNCT_347531 [Trichonephila clavata]
MLIYKILRENCHFNVLRFHFQYSTNTSTLPIDSSAYDVQSVNKITVSNGNPFNLCSYEKNINQSNNPFLDGFTVKISNTLTVLNNPFVEEWDLKENESETSIDEAILLPQPTLFQDSSVSINPFTNPFFDLLTFTDPLANLGEDDADFLCYKWIQAHRHLFICKKMS